MRACMRACVCVCELGWVGWGWVISDLVTNSSKGFCKTNHCAHFVLCRYYSVIVVTGGDETSSTNVEDIGPFNKEQANAANSNGQTYTYITGIVDTSDISDYPYPYMVGDGSRSNVSEVHYENVRLWSNTMYALLVRAHTTGDLVSEIDCKCDFVQQIDSVICFF